MSCEGQNSHLSVGSCKSPWSNKYQIFPRHTEPHGAGTTHSVIKLRVAQGAQALAKRRASVAEHAQLSVYSVRFRLDPLPVTAPASRVLNQTKSTTASKRVKEKRTIQSERKNNKLHNSPW